MRALALALVLAVLALAPCAAEAQRRARGRGARGRASTGAQYRALIREAVSEFDAARWAEARALFLRAHELSPSARTLRGLGMCSFELRDYVEAIDELRAALAERRRALTAGQRRHAQGLIGRAETYVARYTLTISPRAATVRVDGAPIEIAGGELVLGLGEHRLRVEREGYVTDERRLEVRGGERTDLEIRLARAPIEQEAAVVTAAPSAPIDLGVAPVALLIGGGALAVIGIGSAIWLADRDAELAICDAAGPDCVNRDTLAAQRDASVGVTAGAFVSAALLAATGAVLLALTSSSAPASADAEARVGCGPAAAGVVCAGTF